MTPCETKAHLASIMIELQHLTHIYPASRHTPPRRALIDLSLSVGAGKFCILSGPNGSGK